MAWPAIHKLFDFLPPLPCWLTTTAEEREQNKWERAAKHKAYGGTVAYMDKFRTGKIPHLPSKNEGKIPHQVEIRNFPRGIPPPPPVHELGSLKCSEGYNPVFIAAVCTAAKQTTQIRSRPSIYMTYLILHLPPLIIPPPPQHRLQILNLMSKTKYGKNSATIL